MRSCDISLMFYNYMLTLFIF